jgi:hypothetical protein
LFRAVPGRGWLPTAMCLEQMVNMASVSERPTIGISEPHLDSLFVTAYSDGTRWCTLTQWGVDTGNSLILGTRSERTSGQAQSISQLFWQLYDTFIRDQQGWELPDPASTTLCICFGLSSYRLINGSPPAHPPLELVCGWNTSSLKLLGAAEIHETLGWKKLETKISALDNPLRACGALAAGESGLHVRLTREYISLCLGTDFSQLGSLNFGADLDERQATLIVRSNKSSL